MMPGNEWTSWYNDNIKRQITKPPAGHMTYARLTSEY